MILETGRTSSANLVSWQYCGEMKRLAIARIEFEKKALCQSLKKDIQLQWASSMYNIAINNAFLYNSKHTTVIKWQFPLLVGTFHSKIQHMNVITTFCE